MMRVTLKVKTLVKILIGLMLTISSLYFLLPGFLNSDGKFKVPWENSNELYQLALKSIPQFDENRAIVFPSFSSMGVTEPEISTDEGIQYLEYLIQEYPIYNNHHPQINMNLATLYLRKGDTATSIEYLQKVRSFDYPYAEAQKLLSALQHEQTDEIPSLTGKVMIGDQPGSNIFVFLYKRGYTQWSSNYFFSNYPTTYTDENGEYRFYGVDPGEYEVGVSFIREQTEGYYLPIESGTYVTIRDLETSQFDITFAPRIKVDEPSNHQTISGDTIQFSWGSYPGAAYYKVGLTMIESSKKDSSSGSHTFLLEGEWTEPYAEYTIPQVRTSWYGAAKTGDAEGSYLTPSSILGPLYPGGQFSWVVEAYDHAGKRMSSSAGHFLANEKLPLFYMDDHDQLEGDRYVLNWEYDKAIASYEQEGEHPYALRALARMYYHGLTSEDEGDKKKALQYLERIDQPTNGELRMMATCYEELGEYTKSKEIYLQVLESSPDDWGTLSSMARILKKEGDRQGAIDYYEQVLQADSGNFDSANLVLLYLLEKEYNKALGVAKKQPYKHYHKNLYPLLVEVQKKGWKNTLFVETLLDLEKREIKAARTKIAQFTSSESAYTNFLDALGYELYSSSFDDPDRFK